MFERFFKPKWQNSNPAVRLDAISRFSDRDVEHQRILQTLASTDADPAVRLEALKRIVSTDQMLATAGAIDETLLPGALSLVWERVSARVQGDAQVIALFQTLATPQRVKFALKSPVAALAEALVTTLTDDEELKVLAMEAPFASARQRAAQAIETESVLDDIARQVKSRDKGVYRIVKDKLDNLRHQRKTVEDVGQSVRDALQAIEAHARMPVDPLYAAKLEHLHKQWQRVSAHASNDQALQYQRAFDACRDTLAATQEEALKLDSATQARLQALQERQAACAQLEEAYKQLCFNAVLDIGDLPALAGLLTTQRNRWMEASEAAPAEADERKRFKQVFSALEHVLNAGQALQSAAPAITSAATALLESESRNPGDLATLRRQLEQAAQGIRWPGDVRRPEVLELRDRALAHHDTTMAALLEEEERLVARAQTGLAELAREIERGNVKAANVLMRDQQQLLKTLPMRRAEVLQRELRDQLRKLNELRDWQGFATLPKKEALCDDMEALVGLNVDPEVLAGRIRRLQDQWKMLGNADADKSQALWERFSGAADRAYEPCRVYFDNLHRVREANLGERQRIVDQLQQYLDVMDWARADWRAARDILETARQEWRHYAPVERKQGAALQERFNDQLKTLQDKIQQEFEKNAGKRRQLITEAETLLASSDLPSAIERAKQLQRDWKSTGLVSPREDGALWKQFRAACDALFAKRDQARTEGQALRERLQAEAESLCDQLESVLDTATDDLGALQAHVQTLRERFDAIEGLPRDIADTMRQRFRQASDQVKARVQEARHAQRVRARTAVWDVLVALDAIEQDVFENATVERPALDLASIDEPVLRDALAARQAALAGSVGRLPPAEVLSLNEKALRSLCLRLEIAAGMESPAEDQALRMQYQIERFNKGQAQKDSRLAMADLVGLCQREWLAVGVVDPRVREALTARFRRVADRMLEG